MQEIDEHYKTIMKTASASARIDYCYNIIDHSQSTLKNWGRYLSPSAKQDLMTKINAAKKEIENIKSENQEA